MKIILTHIQGSLAGSKTEFEGPTVRVGRDPKDCDLVFESAVEPGVSRLHAEISFLDGVFYLEDLGSRNGTYLDAVPIKGKVELPKGSLIQFGVEGPLVRFEFETGRKSKVPNTQPVLTIGPQAKALASTDSKPLVVCRSCGAEFAVVVKFCRRCGKPIAPGVSAKESESTVPPQHGISMDPEALKEAALAAARKCYSCGEEIVGDPRFCPACGAVLDPDSARLHSDDLRDFMPPPAATAYVALGKMQPPEPPPPPKNVSKRLKKNSKPLSGEHSKQPRVSRRLSDSPPPTPQNLPPRQQISAQIPTESAAPEKRLGKGKIDLPRVQKPGPLIPPARSSANSRQGEQAGSPATGDQGRMSEQLKFAIPNSSSPAHTLLISAQALAKKGHLSQAIEECERAIRIDAQLPEAYNLHGQLLLAQGEGKKAITAFEKALKIRPTMAEAYTNLGQAYLRAGRYKEAAVSAREAIKIDHVIPEAYHTIGQALMEMGDYDRAFEAFTRALRVQPNYPDSYLGIATVQFRCGHAEEAINSCQQALKARPNFPQAYCLMGQAHRAKGQFKEAGHAFHEAIRLKPDYAIAYNYLALNYRSLGLMDEAQTACKKALEIEPGLPEGHNTIGLLYCDRGQYAEGLLEYQQAIEVRPRYAEAHNNLGLCYFKTSELDRSIECFEKAIELEPQFVLARFNLALCFFKKRDKYGVKKQYEALRELDEARAAKLYQKIKTLI